MKKLYLINCDVHDEYPYYTFFIEAKNEIEANEKAMKIAKRDYEMVALKEPEIYSYEIKSLEDIRKRCL